MFEYFVVVFEQARNPGMVQKRIANSDELTGGLTDCRTDGLTDWRGFNIQANMPYDVHKKYP